MTFWTGAGFKVLQNSELPSRQSFYYFNVTPAGSMTRVKVSGSRWRSKTRRWRKFSKNRKFSLRKTTIKEYSFDGWLCQLNNFKSSLRIWYPCLPHGFFLAFMLHLPALFRPDVHYDPAAKGPSQTNLVNYKLHIFLRHIWDYQQYSNNVLLLSDVKIMRL